MRGLARLSGEIPGDAAEGLRIVASFAQSGNTLAMMDLGRAMRDGTTVPRDREAARSWFENAMRAGDPAAKRSEEHTSELQSLMRISYAVFCLKKKKNK